MTALTSTLRIITIILTILLIFGGIFGGILGVLGAASWAGSPTYYDKKKGSF